MRGKKARELRKMAGYNPKQEREYVQTNKKLYTLAPGKTRKTWTEIVKNTPYRMYKKFKKVA